MGRSVLAVAAWLALAAIPSEGRADRIPLHRFSDPGVWRHQSDGGVAPTVAAAAGGMRIVYRDAAPHWGNLTAPCTVPPRARALLVTLTKVRSSGGAAMHLWLWEPDQDAWVTQITADGVPFGQWKAGRRTLRIPVTRFAFEPRGAGTREMTSTSRMLVGCNFADLEVVMNSMEWDIDEGSTRAELPVTPGLSVNSDGRTVIGILDMGPSLPDGFVPAHKPAQLADALSNRGYYAPVLQAGDLVAGGLLTRRKMQALVLPSAPYFPVALREPFLAYLREGGGFIALGGYAFERLVEWNGQAWVEAGSGVTAGEMTQPIPAADGMTTRFGHSGDAMTFAPEQIGIFDPAFQLKNATRSQPSAWLSGIWPTASSRLDAALPKAVEGFAASGLIGDNNPVFPPVYRRWVPMLELTDADGKPRGSALSLMRNHTGPYAGSTWAFSGVTGQKVVLGSQGHEKLLALAAEACAGNMWLRSLRSEFASYSPGETAVLEIRVRNDSDAAKTGTLAVYAEARSVSSTKVRLDPHTGAMVRMRLAIDESLPSIVRLSANLTVGISSADTVFGGLVVRKATTLAIGPKVAWKDNYLTVDGVPRFLLGANQTGFMFYSDREDPAVWDADLLRMAANNVRILRILHFSPFAKAGYEGQASHSSLDLANRPERLCRQMDAIVHLAMKRRVAVFLTLHDWLDVALTDEELRAQADWNAFWADRYKDAPGVFFDIQNEPAVPIPDRPDMAALWNAWLSRKYGSDAALKSAWHVTPPEAALPNVPLKGGSDQWDDVRTADRKRFEAEVLNRWLQANVEGVKRGNPRAPVCVGYLPSMPPADKVLGVRHTDFSNMHYYGDLRGLPLEFSLIDRRAYGKGMSIGEFGAQEAHQARNAGAIGAPDAESKRRFNWTVHHAVGMGGAFVAAWCWKDMDEMVFPWGLWNRGTPVAKPWMETYAALGAFLKDFEPVYERPKVYLLLPDAHRVGPRFDAVHSALQRSVELLLSQQVNFGVLNEEDLAAVPEGARAIFWPLPYCPSDAAFEVVARWVVAGGTLYFSGGIGFDGARRPTQEARYAMLGLPRRQDVPPFDVPDAVWGEPPMESKAGKGRVLFAPYPLELRPHDTDEALYAVALHRAGVHPNTVRAPGGTVRCLTIPDRRGGQLTMLVRTDTGEQALPVRLPSMTANLQMPAGACAFVLTGSDGKVTAIEMDGKVVAKP